MLNKRDELKDQIDAKRATMVAALAELKADTRHEAIVAKDKLKEGLAQLDQELNAGWEKLSDAVRTKLAAWLQRH